MIAAEDWWNVLINFNETIMPFQFIWAGIALILTIWFAIKPGKITNILLKIYFILSFAFISIVFFVVLGQELPAFIGQAICFGLIAILLAIDLKFNKFQFTMPEKLVNKVIMFISLGFVFLYPVLGMITGHVYPRMIIFGTFPCPTTALALVFATASLPNIKLEWKSIGLYATWILLLVWAIPFPIAIQIPQFKAYEDIVMLSIGVYGLIRLIWRLIHNGIQLKKGVQVAQTQETVN